MCPMLYPNVFSVMLDTPHSPDYVADRGPVKYFYWRKRIIISFKKLIEDSMRCKGINVSDSRCTRCE